MYRFHLGSNTKPSVIYCSAISTFFHSAKKSSESPQHQFPKRLTFTPIISVFKWKVSFPLSKVSAWCKNSEGYDKKSSDRRLLLTCDPEVNKRTTAAKKGSKTEFSLLSSVALFLAHSLYSAVMSEFADLHNSNIYSFPSVSYFTQLISMKKPQDLYPPISNLTFITAVMTKI